LTALTLAFFVAGAWLLQQQRELPGSLALLLLALAALSAALAGTRLPAGAAAARWGRGALWCVAAAALGFCWAGWRADLRMADELAAADEGRDIVVIGIIDSLPAQLDRGQRFELAVESVQTEGVRLPQRLALSWYGQDAGVVPAERWRFTVRLRRPHGSVNPGGFDLEAWMLERNLRASGYVREGSAKTPAPQRLAASVPDAGAWVDRVRYHLRLEMQQRLAGERYAGVLVALVLGDQRAIAESDWLMFNATGIGHLVSISGLHITMIAGLAAGLASLLWRRSARLMARAPAQTAAAVAGMLAALAYCLLAGWAVPAQRTFFMLAVVAAGLLLRLSLAPSLTLALAAAVVTLLDPWASAAPGFWLSFGAVAAILFALHGQLREAAGWRARLQAAAQVQGAVTIALVPMTVALFQQVSLVSPLANAVAIPVVSLAVTPLALAGAALALLPAPLDALATLPLSAGHGLFALLADLLHAVARWRWASVALPAPPPWALLCALGGVLWLLMPRGWPLRGLGLIGLLPLVLWPAPRPAVEELWVTAIDIGQGSSVLVETRDARLLVDTGPRYTAQADAGGRVILPYLRWRGIGRLDTLVVTHLDSDHSGGAASLLRAMPGTPVITSIDPEHPMLREAGPVQRCAAGQQLRFGELNVSVLHPAVEDYALRRSTNAMSCVLLIEFRGLRVLLTGDIPAREEAAMSARVQIGPVTLLSAPHHGSKHSSSAALLTAAPAAEVLVQAGYRNRFGHPDPAVLARYARTGTLVARSDWGGALQWRMKAGQPPEVSRSAARETMQRYWFNRPGPPLPSARRLDDDVDEDDMPAAAGPSDAESIPFERDAAPRPGEN